MKYVLVSLALIVGAWCVVNSPALLFAGFSSFIVGLGVAQIVAVVAVPMESEVKSDE